MTEVTVGDSDPGAMIEAWRARGEDRFDPVRFRLIEALARRSESHRGEARRILDDKLHGLLRAYGDAVDQKARHPDVVANGAGPDPGSRNMLGASGALGALVEGLAPEKPFPAGDTLAYFRATWSRLSAERNLTQSLTTVPENAGPLNSQQLVHRSLTSMRDLSPAYLHHFMSYVDALLRLDQGFGGAVPSNAEGQRAERPRKARSKAR